MSKPLYWSFKIGHFQREERFTFIVMVVLVKNLLIVVVLVSFSLQVE